jgi:hypothetical protein
VPRQRWIFSPNTSTASSPTRPNARKGAGRSIYDWASRLVSRATQHPRTHNEADSHAMRLSACRVKRPATASSYRCRTCSPAWPTTQEYEPRARSTPAHDDPSTSGPQERTSPTGSRLLSTLRKCSRQSGTTTSSLRHARIATIDSSAHESSSIAPWRFATRDPATSETSPLHAKPPLAERVRHSRFLLSRTQLIA